MFQLPSRNTSDFGPRGRGELKIFARSRGSLAKHWYPGKSWKTPANVGKRFYCSYFMLLLHLVLVVLQHVFFFGVQSKLGFSTSDLRIAETRRAMRGSPGGVLKFVAKTNWKLENGWNIVYFEDFPVDLDHFILVKMVYPPLNTHSHVKMRRCVLGTFLILILMHKRCSQKPTQIGRRRPQIWRCHGTTIGP